MNTPERNVVQALLDTYKTTCFTSGTASNAQAMGLLLSRFFHFDGGDLLDAAQYALEDANFHTQAAQVATMAAELRKVDDDALIDHDTRTAIFAALNEVYPGISKDRGRRLAKLNLLAQRPADNPITSLSNAYCDMTVGDAGRVFEMLHELREVLAS